MNNKPLHTYYLSANSREHAKNEMLKDMWCYVFDQASPNFFLSWQWISAWLNSIDQSLDFIYTSPINISEPLNLANISPEDIYGCAFVHKNSQLDLKYFVFQQPVYLNRTGILADDQIWIEYNDFLVTKLHAQQAQDALSNHILSRTNASLIMGISQTKLVTDLCKRNEWQYMAVSESHAFQKSLTVEHHDLEKLIAGFSKNTKSQLRRSIKLLKQSDDIEMHLAQTSAQAIDWFHEAGEFHKALWQSTAQGSGFDNKCFVDFHEHLIKQCFENNEVLIAKFTVAEKPVGFIYGFVFNNTFYFYLSALAKSSNAKIKLGLVAHLYLMQALAAKQIHTYDFMGGSARYKESLSDASTAMGFYRITNNKTLFSIDSALRKVKQKMRKQ